MFFSKANWNISLESSPCIGGGGEGYDRMSLPEWGDSPHARLVYGCLHHLIIYCCSN